MSSNSIDFTCLDKMIDKLNNMGKKAEKVYDRALKNGASPILAEIIARCPTSDVNHTHARGKLKLSNIIEKEEFRSIKVGIQRGDISEIYYLKFVEYGTVKQSAKPFMQPAFEATKDTAYKIVVDEITRAFKEAFGE